MTFRKDELLRALKNGEKFHYVFFWGHRSFEGTVGPSCCSQWFEAGFDVDGNSYPTAEHFMMAEKARLFSDQEMLARILECRSPSEAKSFGRKVKGFDNEIWTSNCYEIVVRGNVQKFSQNPRLAHWLLSTEPAVLVEASPTDPIWGIGVHHDDPASRDPFKWPGQNLLGFALMKVRGILLGS